MNKEECGASWIRRAIPASIELLEKKTNDIFRRLSGIPERARAGQWWNWKIPPLLAIAYGIVFTEGIPPVEAFFTLAVLTISAVCVAAYAHIVNDIFDVDVDALAEKPNAMAGYSRVQRVLLVTLLGSFGIIPWFFVDLSASAFLLLFIIYTLPFLYSAPPARLKDRKLWGVLADAAYAHAIPNLFAGIVFLGLSDNPNVASKIYIAFITAWGFLWGLRGIIIHQLNDRNKDLISGVRTFVVEMGVNISQNLVNQVVFPLELSSLIILGVIISFWSPEFVLILLAYAIIFQIARTIHVWENFEEAVPGNPHQSAPVFQTYSMKISYDNAAPLELNSYVPLANFYSTWPALGFLILLTSRNLSFFILLILHIALFHKIFAREFHSLCSIFLLLFRKIFWSIYAYYYKHIHIKYRKVRRFFREKISISINMFLFFL